MDVAGGLHDIYLTVGSPCYNIADRTAQEECCRTSFDTGMWPDQERAGGAVGVHGTLAPAGDRQGWAQLEGMP